MSKKNQVTKKCATCEKEFSVPASWGFRKNCSQACYSLYQKSHPSNTGRTHFKKDSSPWNKDKITFSDRRKQEYYRRIVFEYSPNVLCNRCPKDAKLVHHIDGDYLNNAIENLEPLCYSCHSIEHNVVENLPIYGGWSKRRMKK